MNKRRILFETKQTNKPPANIGYDILDDWPLIEASMLMQYGIRLRAEEITFDEFSTYLPLLNDKTPFGRIVYIRTTTDADALEHMSEDEKKIRLEWNNKYYGMLNQHPEWKAYYQNDINGITAAFKDAAIKRQ